jgi:DNA-binding transcriptional ArsR family regulator
MAVSVVVEGAAADAVAVHVDPLAELAAFGHALLHGDHHPHAAAARSNVFGTGGEDFVKRLRYLGPFFGVVRARVLLPTDIDASAAPSLEDRFAQVRAMPIADFARMSATAIVEESLVFAGENPLDHPDIYLRQLKRMSHTPVELGRQLLEQPDSVREALLALAEDLYSGWFEREWHGVAMRLSRARDLLRREIARLGPVAIASVSSTSRIEENPACVVFDKINRARYDVAERGLILVPSVFIQPHLAIKHGQSSPTVIQFPVGGHDGESLDLVKRKLDALHDSSRIEICRNVSRAPMTTADLAMHLQMTEPQVSRHLRTLRAAQLVHRSQRGRFVYYSLNKPALDGLGASLIDVMLR